MDDPVGFGQKHKAEITQMADIHDLALLPFSAAGQDCRLQSTAWPVLRSHDLQRNRHRSR